MFRWINSAEIIMWQEPKFSTDRFLIYESQHNLSITLLDVGKLKLVLNFSAIWNLKQIWLIFKRNLFLCWNFAQLFFSVLVIIEGLPMLLKKLYYKNYKTWRSRIWQYYYFYSEDVHNERNFFTANRKGWFRGHFMS